MSTVFAIFSATFALGTVACTIQTIRYARQATAAQKRAQAAAAETQRILQEGRN